MEIAFVLWTVIVAITVTMTVRSKNRWRDEVARLAKNPDNVLAILSERGWSVDRCCDMTGEQIGWRVGGEYDDSLSRAWAKANAVYLARQTAVEEEK